jgi:hypothetical protein
VIRFTAEDAEKRNGSQIAQINTDLDTDCQDFQDAEKAAKILAIAHTVGHATSVTGFLTHQKILAILQIRVQSEILTIRVQILF